MQGFVLTFYLMALISMNIHGGLPQPLKEFDTGGKRGWKVSESDNPDDTYNHWAERMRFRAGDSIRFQYQNDSVLVVEKYGYYHCETEGPISFDDGSTVISLDGQDSSTSSVGTPITAKRPENDRRRYVSSHKIPSLRRNLAGAMPMAHFFGSASFSAQAAATLIVSVYASVFAFI